MKMVLHTNLMPEPRPECPTFILTIFTTDDPEIVYYKFGMQCQTDTIFEGEYPLDEGFRPGDPFFLLELFDFLTEDDDEDDEYDEVQEMYFDEYADAVFDEALRQYGRGVS